MEDLEPGYCIRCRKPIPRSLAERQGACDECRQELEALARGETPLLMPPGPGRTPPCLRCGADEVQREWRADRVSDAVDAVTGVVSLLFPRRQRACPRPENEVGPARTLEYHCLRCDARWRPRR